MSITITEYDLLPVRRDKQNGISGNIAGGGGGGGSVNGAVTPLSANEILTRLLTVDGTGTGLDADLLDGNHANAFALTDDARLSDARPASDVYAWAKAADKPSYNKSEVGLDQVDNTADAFKNVAYALNAGAADDSAELGGVPAADYALLAGPEFTSHVQITGSDGSDESVMSIRPSGTVAERGVAKGMSFYSQITDSNTVYETAKIFTKWDSNSWETSRFAIASRLIGGTWSDTFNIKGGNTGFGFTAALAKVAINGGCHIGGESDPGDNNLLVDGNITGVKLQTANWSLEEDGSNNLIIKYGSTVVTKLTTAGYLSTADEQESFDTL